MADGLFDTAPKEVRAYFERRAVRTSWRWTDLAPHEHALGFTVARTAGYDVIEDLRTAVRKAVVDRVPFDQFQNELTPVLQQKGWWGKKVVKGPGGFKEEVQLGSLRRLRTIYWANIRSSHAAGEWARTIATRDFLPYLRYKVSLAAEKRKEHLSWVGTTLPVEHRWWRTHYPPNGWNCQCRVEQIGEVAAGKTPPEKRKAPPLNMRLWRDRRSGKVWRVPDGIDPGWQTNPGITRERTAAILHAGRINMLSHSSRITAIADNRSTAAFRYIAGNEAGLPYPLPRGADRTEGQQRAARLMTPVAAVPETETFLRPGALHLSGEDAAKMLRKHSVSIAAYELVQHILENPDVTLAKANGKLELIKMIEGKPWLAIIKWTADGLILLNSFHRIDLARFQRIIDRTRDK